MKRTKSYLEVDLSHVIFENFTYKTLEQYGVLQVKEINLAVGDLLIREGYEDYVILGKSGDCIILAQSSESTNELNNIQTSTVEYLKQQYTHSRFNNDVELLKCEEFNKMKKFLNFACIELRNFIKYIKDSSEYENGYYYVPQKQQENNQEENKKMESDTMETIGLKGNFKIESVKEIKDGKIITVINYANTISKVDDRVVTTDLGRLKDVMNIINLDDKDMVILEAKTPKVIVHNEIDKYINVKTGIVKLDLGIQLGVYKGEELINMKGELAKLEAEVQTLDSKISYSLKW